MTEGILGVVIARGGSKGVPGKNVADLGGHPLIAYTIECARRADNLERVILSTDDEEIAAAGRRYGVEVPFMRPAELARDETHPVPVIEHAVSYLRDTEGASYDAVVTLQPTTPFRLPRHVDEAIGTFQDEPAYDSVIGVTAVDVPPHRMFTKAADGLTPFVDDGTDYSLKRRQEFPTVYRPNGAVYVTSPTILEEGRLFSDFTGGSTGAVETDALHSHDMEYISDLTIART
jgi:CMP-N-acetylneuraminic acid synthetase